MNTLKEVMPRAKARGSWSSSTSGCGSEMIR